MLKQVQHDNGEVLIMKLIIVGGHLSPALAVIEALQKDVNVLFIGRKYVFEGSKTLSLEFRTITKRKIPFVSISTGRWQRKFTRFTIPSLLKFPFGILQSFLILKKFKPDVVLSFGGYLSLPVGIAAFILRIPIVIHEQTLEAGIANKVLSIFAKTVCISWETSRKYFPKSKVILTGNPMRKFEIRNSKLGTIMNCLFYILPVEVQDRISLTHWSRDASLNYWRSMLLFTKQEMRKYIEILIVYKSFVKACHQN